jgi:threonine dehydrogenase-like Zn-dependent dehydrogenase
MSRAKGLRSKFVPPGTPHQTFGAPNQTDDAEIRIVNGGPSLAVIGCGYWGAKHIRVSCDIRGARMAMAVDPHPDRLEYVRSQYPSVAVSRDIGAVLNNPSIDGVIVATPAKNLRRHSAAIRILAASSNST